MIDILKVKVGDKLRVALMPGKRNYHYGSTPKEFPAGTIITVGEVDRITPSVKAMRPFSAWFIPEECCLVEEEEMSLGPEEKLAPISSLKVGQLFLTQDRLCMAMVTDALPGGATHSAVMQECGVGDDDPETLMVGVTLWKSPNASGYGGAGFLSVWGKDGDDVLVLPE